ncbi:hypothetical protein GCM10010841_07390 [Deinococcus aerophilus]|uniref:Lipoprotein n=2 Tax=Deinococcus aerophilus TaxID=522488 RepID=A0ABQ2GL55_9DEIO|nr:hypothetical protein GCM10010841_07390 [Deinococcus aerophilus]
MARVTLEHMRGFSQVSGVGRAAVGVWAVLALGSCAPRTSGPAPTVQASTPVSAVSFYPHEPGLGWSYLLEGEPTTTTPYVLRTLGPTIYAGQNADALQLTGRGADQTWYRTFSAAGVQLLGLRKPGVNVRLDPPWLEYPAETGWKVGLNWRGQSGVTISGDDGKVQAQGTLNYSYTVQERRPVDTPAGKFDVWVVTRQVSDTVGGLFPATQQLWFTPYVGEVRTPEGLLLVRRNFTTPGGR